MKPNPFSLPGRPDPWEALDPQSGDPSEVLKQYVAVDNTEDAFVQFSETLPGPAELTRRGQLVVAMGMDGGGKSSLINRCAWAAKKKIEAAGFQPVLVDARNQARVTEEEDVRIKQVADYLVLALESDNLARIQDHERGRLATTPVDLYPRLRHYLQDKIVVLVQLPWTERIEEIVHYAQLSHPRLVFFAELRGPFGLEAVRRQVERSDFRRPIIMEVGPLRAGHGAAFVNNRFELSEHDNVKPMLEPEVVERMISSRGPSIRELQKFLYLMYERLRGATNAPETITWEYALEAYYQVGDEL